MNATRILMDEHRVIERVLTALETAARKLAAGQPVRPGFFVEATDFIKGFADGAHHHKEEGLLFPALELAGMPRQAGPVGVMLMEHEEGRRLTRGLRAAAEGLAAGQLTQRDAVVQNALGYVALLRQHIAKEDNVLFQMADRLLAPDAQASLNTQFEQARREPTHANAHTHHLALAERLAAEAGG